MSYVDDLYEKEYPSEEYNYNFVTMEEIRKWYREKFDCMSDDESMKMAYKREFYPVIKDKSSDNNSFNNGGKTDYYQLSSSPFTIDDFDDFAEWRGMNGNQFNIGKAVWAFNVGRHSGTDYVRDLNKIIHYANRELDRLNREGK